MGLSGTFWPMQIDHLRITAFRRALQQLNHLAVVADEKILK